MSEDQASKLGVDPTAVGLQEDSKKPWLSKTIWTGVIFAAASLFPPTAAVIGANPSLAGIVAGAIVIGLRFISDGKVSFK